MAFIYKDVNPLNPTTKPTLQDVEAIHLSIFNILNTRTGEDLFRPEFGIDLEDTLFELLDDLTALDVFRRLVTAIETFEPRVVIDTTSTTVTANEVESKFDVTLVFSLVGEDEQTFEIKGALAA